MDASRMLRERVAGESAMLVVVTAQSVVPAQSRWERVLGISPLTREASVSYRGALGEFLVGDVVDNLGPRWDSLHDLPLPDSQLEHLAIGPAGVFAIHLVHCTGVDVVIEADDILAVGERRDDLATASAKARQVSILLGEAVGAEVTVSPMVVIVRPARIARRGPAPSPWIVSSGELDYTLRHAPEALSGEQVARISDVADLEQTWAMRPASALDSQALHRQFALIRARVRTALTRRVAWAALATACVFATVCAIVATLVSIFVAR